MPPTTPHAAVVVLAGGSGTRVGAGMNKVYLPLGGRRVISWSLLQAAEVPAVRAMVLVIRPEDAALARSTLAEECPGLTVAVVTGGSSRHASEQAALTHLAPAVAAGDIDVVVIHDGARPLAGANLFRKVIDVAAAHGGAVPGVAADDLLPRDPGTNGTRSADVPAAGAPAPDVPASPGLVAVQTPQAFRAAELLAAYAEAAAAGEHGTDTAATLERFSRLPVHLVPGTRRNVKVTYPADVALVERLLAADPEDAPLS
ncbi:MAG: 2-C-methyl-D-erythritol 4-phosphate cytidylyltransferase [Kineosporiaceae bacterium]